MFMFYMHGKKTPWYELALGRTCSGTKSPGMKPPAMTLQWEQASINRLVRLRLFGAEPGKGLARGKQLDCKQPESYTELM